MKNSIKGLVLGMMLASVVPIASGYSTPIEDETSETVTNDWDAGYQLTVGHNTASNMLTITDGGTVFDGVGIVGELTGADENSAVVSGNGSSWTNTADLVIGNYGAFNTLVVTNGGYVQNANGQIGVEVGSVSNSVVLSGSNTVWNNTDTLRIGVAGDSNTLLVQDGAVLESRYGAIGFDPLAMDNNVIITGDGSIWSNSGELVIGALGNSNNALTITNGGTVVVGGQLVFENSPSNDLYLEDGGTLRIDEYADLMTGGFHYKNGSTLEVSGSVWFDRTLQDRQTLVFDGENANWLGTDLGNYLLLDGSSNRVVFTNGAQEGVAVVSVGVNGDHNRVLLTGVGSTLSVAPKNTFVVGGLGSYNEFRVENGASVAIEGEGFDYIGEGYSDINGNPAVVVTSNWLVVEGDGSSFDSANPMTIGLNGVSNGIVVLNGGQVGLADQVILGSSTNSHSNMILVDGTNSSFSTGSLIVGDDSEFNIFMITNGAQAVSSDSFIGVSTNGHNNQVIVSGEGSSWNAGALIIGEFVASNSNNSLTIQNEGMVMVSGITISTNGVGNELNLEETGWLTVSGEMDASIPQFNWASNSTLEAQGVLKNMSSSNCFNISAFKTNGLDHYEYHDGSRRLILSGSGEWDSTADPVLTDLDLDPDYQWVIGYTTVGYEDSANQLHVVGGARVVDSHGIVGDLATSDDNLVVISGAGSLWSNNVGFVLGEYGAGNSLVVTNGGSLWSWGSVYIGNGAGSDGNEVLVAGPESLLYAHGRLSLGDYGSSNALSITGGATVESISAYVGRNSNGNQVLIADAGSSWDNISDLHVGYSGSGNSFVVTNGGESLVARNLYIGTSSGANSNRVTVAGSDSCWSTSFNSHVGRQSDGNELRILDGAQMYDYIGLLGTDNGSDHNSALIDGANSLWYNRHTFFVGNLGSSNTVTVQNDATLVNTTGYIGYHTNADGNQVSVNNATWENSDNLFIGFNGSGNSLVISNDAEVISQESRIGSEGFANDNQVLVTGSGSVWNVSGLLRVGDSANSNNTLIVEDGGRVTVQNTISVGTDNQLYVNDKGTLTVYGDTLFSDGFNLASGGTLETFGGVSGIGGTLESNRTLQLSGSNASWAAAESILVESGAMLDIGAGAVASTLSNYTQQANATLRFGMSTNNSGAPLGGFLEVGQVADFADGANFIYSSDIGALSFDATYTNTLVQSSTLVVGGQTNATTSDLNHYLDSDGTLAGITFVAENDDILAVINRVRVSDWLNPVNEDLKSVLDEVDEQASEGDSLANEQLGIINYLTQEQALSEVTQFYTRGNPTYQHMDGVLSGLKQIDKRTSEMLMSTGYYVSPNGAYGPASKSEWRGWVNSYGNRISCDESSSGLSGYDASTYGTVLGIDKSFDNMIMGLAGGYAGSTIDQDDHDKSDATTAYGAIYATFRLENVDVDLIGSYGSSSVENESGTTFGSKSEMDASTMAFYIGASEEAISGPITFAPVVAFQAANYSQDGYDEVSQSAVGRSVEAYDRWSYQSIVGGTFGSVKMLKNFDLITRVRANWKHEFNTDPENLNYTLINGTDSHYFVIRAPVKDSFDLDLSLGALFGEKLELSLGLNGQYSKEFTAIGYSGKIQYSF